MFAWLRPKETLTEDEVSRGLRPLLLDGVFAQSMGVLTSGAFLVAFALLLGASLKVIGLLAAIGPFSQMLQIPAIFLIDRTRRRKALVVIPVFVSRLLWLLIAALPWLLPPQGRLVVLLVCLFASSGFGAVAGCAWNSWIRDLVPEKLLGSYFAKRMAAAIAVGAAVSLLAGFGIDLFRRNAAGLGMPEVSGYSILFAVGVVLGMFSTWSLTRVPEPRMAPSPGQSVFAMLAQPFRDTRYRSLLFFVSTWTFAVNFAAPFFTVYMLSRLGLGISLVIILAVVSQIFNVLFLRLWGRLADRFTNKSVLTVSAPMFIVSILLWPFLTMPERYFLTIPLLVLIHALAGMSAAGVSLCTGNIALKAAPKGTATAYLATNALIAGIAATIAPILAGAFGDALAGQELSLTLRWTGQGGELFSLPAISLRGLDFVFLLAFVFGLYAVHRLLAIKEYGEVEESIVVNELYAEARRVVRTVTTVEGLRQLTLFPYMKLRQLIRPKTGDTETEHGNDVEQAHVD